MTYAKENLKAAVVDEKFDHFLNELRWAVKLNLDFGLVLKNKEGGRFSYFYAHERNLSDGVTGVCAKDDLTKQKKISQQDWRPRVVQ